jgi:UDP-2-acetamido-3-amino-2,3-dideoxy-glucuronate N-acetyltransferase
MEYTVARKECGTPWPRFGFILKESGNYLSKCAHPEVTEMNEREIFVHPTAIVDEGAKIGNGSRIWHWTHVSSGAVIGNCCSLGQNVFVGNLVVIGNGVKVQNNVSIYDKVTLEDEVFCGPSMVFTNVYNPRAAIVRKSEYRPTLVKRGATLGANSTIVCGVTIGKYAFIAAGAVVKYSVTDFALMVGVPTRQIGWMSAWGERLPLPLSGGGFAVCPHTGDKYELNGNKLSRLIT